jgi:hypothetical protein
MKADPRAKRILEQLASKLDRLQELDVIVRSKQLSIHNENKNLHLTATVTVKFRRPVATWRLLGKTTQVQPWDLASGAPFELHATRTGATFSISYYNGGKPQPVEGIIPALEALRGVTGETANVIPDLLLHEPFEEPQWNPSRKRMLPYLAERAQLETVEAFDGHPCYRVQSVRETGTWTLWIDKQTLLPRGVMRTKDGDQIKSSGMELAGKITHIEAMHHLEIKRAK